MASTNENVGLFVLQVLTDRSIAMNIMNINSNESCRQINKKVLLGQEEYICHIFENNRFYSVNYIDSLKVLIFYKQYKQKYKKCFPKMLQMLKPLPTSLKGFGFGCTCIVFLTNYYNN